MARSRDVKVAILGDAKDFERAFTKAEDDAKELGKTLDTVSDDVGRSSKEMGDKLGDSLSGLSSKFEDQGKELGGLLAGGIGLGGAGAAALFFQGMSLAMDAESSKANLTARLGLDPESSRKAGEIAGSVYAGAYGESAGQVNDAVIAVHQNIANLRMAPADDVEALTKKVLDLAAAFGEDVGPIAAAAGQMIRNGLAKDGHEAFDILTKGFQNGANKSEDLLDTFNEYGTQFRELGIDGKTALGLLSQGLQAGARDADTVADTLKEFAIIAQDGSEKTLGAFKRLGLNGKQMGTLIAEGGDGAQFALQAVLDRLREIEDPIVRNNTAIELFGTKAEDMQNALGALDTRTAVEQLGNVEGAAKTVGDTLGDTAATRVETWKRQMEANVVTFIDEMVIPALDRMSTGIDKASQDFLTGLSVIDSWFDSHPAIGDFLGGGDDWNEVRRALGVPGPMETFVPPAGQQERFVNTPALPGSIQPTATGGFTLNIHGEPDPVLVAKMMAAAKEIAQRERIAAGKGLL